MTDWAAKVEQLDRDDALASWRQQFHLPEGVVYLDGNSLGPLPQGAADGLQTVLAQEWGQDLIRSWNKHNWIDLPTKVGEKIAPLLGAAPGQTLCCDSISVNLFKLLGAALSLRPDRSVVLSQADNFPTDLYTAEGLSGLLGEQRCTLKTTSTEDLEAALNEEVAVLMLTQVNFRSGEVHDIARLTQLAHEVGALVIWDLAHSAGALPLALDEWQVDFAVGCGYKYLNGGPGAPAFLYAAARHQAALMQPLSGWMGHKSPFAFDPEYEAADGVEQFLSGTPSVLAMSVLDAALEVYAGVDMSEVRSKSLRLTEVFMQMVADSQALSALQCITPQEDALRGSQVSYTHPDGYAIAQCLISAGVIIDFRAPDIMRFGFNALYTSFADVQRAVEALTGVVESAAYQQAEFQTRARVT